MGERIAYLGPSNNNKKEELFQKSIDYLKNNKGDKFCYLLPNGKLLDNYRKRFIDILEKSFEINLFTFDDIVDEVIKDKFFLNIKDPIKDIIIKNILNDLVLDNHITYYRDFIHMEGFIKSISNIIGEIKRSLIYPEDFLINSPDSPFYKEIGKVYREYERHLLENNLVDREGNYFESLSLLKESHDFFKDLDFVIIDEFYDFRPMEIAILKELCKTNISIYINMPFEMENRLSNLEKTLSTLKNIGFQIESVKKEQFNLFETISFNLFSNKNVKLDFTDKIRIIKAPYKYLELKRIFEEVKRFNSEGVFLKEMALVLLNEDYLKPIFKVAKEEKMPLNLNKDIALAEIPLIKEFLCILEAKLNRYTKNSIINRVKSSYFSLIDTKIRNEVEYIIRKQRFNTLEELMTNIEEEQSLNMPFDYISLIKNMNEKLQEEYSNILDKATVNEYSELFLKIIDQYSVEDNLLERYKEMGGYNLLYRDLTALNKLKELINTLTNQLNLIVKEITLLDYYNALKFYLEKETIIEIQGNENGLNVLTPINGRGLKYKIVFIAGLSQENYPSLKDENFFFNEDNYIVQKKMGLDVKDYYEKINNEVLKFSSVISSCDGILYLSYCESSSDEGKDIPSMFLEEILSFFEEEKTRTINVDMDYLLKNNIDEITTKKDFSNYLLFNYYKGEGSLEDYFYIHNYLDKDKLKVINDKIYCEAERYKDAFNQYNGLLDDENIKKDIRNLHKDKIYSNTYLESYAKCPYYFLLNNLLEVDEIEKTFEYYSPIDMGNVYHKVLRQYYLTFKEEITDHVSGKEVFIVEETLDYLLALVQKNCRMIGINTEQRMGELILENTFDRLKEFIEKDIDRLTNGKEKLIPMDFEVEFGRDSTFEIEINGEKIKLAGVIDRVDKSLKDNKYVIIDYKSSDFGLRDIEDIKKGLSLQLPIYIMSQHNKDVVAAAYGTLSKGSFDIKLGLIDETKLIIKRNKGALNKEEWDNLIDITKKKIIEFREGILNGDFSINPLECSSYCIYKNICRYKDALEVE
ncbi:PD-(D/E)XK nuclease family protein [Tissierella sp. MSJ-40]|uniref:PD-(D/E)XK nuclease family protein n=1 Tax=Tissierella simiarum TaxID=2841534 RepID=A0ABS6E3B8_9FIRM|nr:PD-(D/E)XK nuclease family protein [Tissierella simiarum]MBU5437399.1 PD-(D/E)XK nuclease family protein [Tissierella simiarum]